MTLSRARTELAPAADEPTAEPAAAARMRARLGRLRRLEVRAAAGARAAAQDAARQPPEGRHPAGRPRLRGRRALPPRPAAPQRRPLHLPSARGRARSSPSSAWSRRRCARRCCTTPSRTPPCRWRTSRREFGDEVGRLVDGVTKLDKVRYGESAEAETIRKMVVAMARDPEGADRQARRPAAQHAHPVAGCRRTSSSGSPSRPSRSTRRWRTGSA